jgi:hypothetical protein
MQHAEDLLGGDDLKTDIVLARGLAVVCRRDTGRTCQAGVDLKIYPLLVWASQDSMRDNDEFFKQEILSRSSAANLTPAQPTG